MLLLKEQIKGAAPRALMTTGAQARLALALQNRETRTGVFFQLSWAQWNVAET